jgi:hypothetical protein
MKNKSKKQPKIKDSPHPTKLPKVENHPSDDLFPKWCFLLMDINWDKYGWEKLTSQQTSQLLKYISGTQSMKWNEIKKKNSKSGKYNKNVPTSEIIKVVQDRLKYLKMDDTDEIFSFHVTNMARIWGIKENETFKFLWYDPNHEICPTKK